MTVDADTILQRIIFCELLRLLECSGSAAAVCAFKTGGVQEGER